MDNPENRTVQSVIGDDRSQSYVQHKVIGIETIPLHIPFSGPYKIAAGGVRSHLEVLLVRIRIEGGLEGIGETQAWRRQGSVETMASLKEAITNHLAPRVLGRSPFDLPAIVAEMDTALDKSLYAKAPIIDALYDLQGKILGVPVHALLGGRFREKLGGCAVLTIHSELEATLAEADDFHARGFRSFTVKIGNDQTKDVRNVRAIRERFPDVLIRVDANAQMRFDDALALLRKIQVYEIDTAEQLIGMWDLEGMAELVRRIDIPIMADECVATEHDLLEVIKRRAATVMQTKIAKNGGIWGCRRLWTLAQAAGMRIYPGNHPCTSIASASVAHMAAAWPDELLEGPFASGICGALQNDIVNEPLEIEGRFIRVPTAPGLGVTLEEGAVRSLRADI